MESVNPAQTRKTQPIVSHQLLVSFTLLALCLNLINVEVALLFAMRADWIYLSHQPEWLNNDRHLVTNILWGLINQLALAFVIQHCFTKRAMPICFYILTTVLALIIRRLYLSHFWYDYMIPNVVGIIIGCFYLTLLDVGVEKANVKMDPVKEDINRLMQQMINSNLSKSIGKKIKAKIRDDQVATSSTTSDSPESSPNTTTSTTTTSTNNATSGPASEITSHIQATLADSSLIGKENTQTSKT